MPPIGHIRSARRLVAQFGFAVKYPWLPRELALLEAAAERVRGAAERHRLESENLRLEAEARRAEEEERRRVGRELHDEAGQSLLLLRLQLEMMERDAPPALRSQLGAARGVAETAITEIRRIVSALSPAVLERLGLAAALRHLGARFGKMHSAAIALRIPRRIPALPAWRGGGDLPRGAGVPAEYRQTFFRKFRKAFP